MLLLRKVRGRRAAAAAAAAISCSFPAGNICFARSRPTSAAAAAEPHLAAWKNNGKL